MYDQKPQNKITESTAIVAFSPEFGKRLALVIARIGTQREAARIAGVTDEQLGRWKTGKSKASFGGIAALAYSADVNLNWLATGKGDMTLAPDNRQGARLELSRECLAAALRGAEAVEHEQGISLEFDKKLDLIISIYQSVVDDP